MKSFTGKLKDWSGREVDPVKCEELGRALEISPRLAELLCTRGLDSEDAARKFLNPSLHDLPDPFLMAGMEKAVDRLVRAFRRQEKIFVFGDYDMDGISATAILVDYLRRTGFSVDYSIPSRLLDGYGLNPEALKKAVEAGAGLALTVDCGISDLEEIDYAADLSLDVIITDHHQVPEHVPAAWAVINPHLEECSYPDCDLAGVGVAFNLMIALRQGLRRAGLAREINLLRYLDLVALGTVADVMPLTGVNRIFVTYGLKEINASPRCGLRALLKACGITREQQITSRDLVFRLAPKVNAVGRVADATTAVELFLTQDQARAVQLARHLMECNERRQQIEMEIRREAEEMLGAEPELARGRVILLASENWHPGVVGIVATRIMEIYHKPAILLARENGIGRGSGRSLPGLDLVKALDHCQAVLERYGGHAQAVGLTILEERIPVLRRLLNSYFEDNDLEPETRPQLRFDAILSASEINRELLQELAVLQPFGFHNPEPVFVLPDMELLRVSPLGRNGGRHYKFSFISADRRQLTGICFNFTGELPRAGQSLDLAFTLEENTWKGRSELRINLIDYSPASPAGS